MGAERRYRVLTPAARQRSPGVASRRGLMKDKRVTRTCKHCGKPFLVQISQLRRPGGGGFCGKPCHYAWQRETSIRELSHSMIGRRFGRLTVLRFAARVGTFNNWTCECDCGNVVVVRQIRLSIGHTKSCGCLISAMLIARNLSHGKRRTPEYKVWAGMKSRCARRGDKAYPNYGGRGITVCERWQNSFENFLADMGPRPSPLHSIERNDVNGNYEPGNCRWIPMPEQASNTRKTIRITLRGVTRTLSQWCRELGIPVTTACQRYHLGLTPEQVLAR